MAEEKRWAGIQKSGVARQVLTLGETLRTRREATLMAWAVSAQQWRHNIYFTRSSGGFRKAREIA